MILGLNFSHYFSDIFIKERSYNGKVLCFFCHTESGKFIIKFLSKNISNIHTHVFDARSFFTP